MCYAVEIAFPLGDNFIPFQTYVSNLWGFVLEVIFNELELSLHVKVSKDSFSQK